MTPSYDLAPFEDQYGKGYSVVVGGENIGAVRRTTSVNNFNRWEGLNTTSTGEPLVCRGSTRREVADTVATRAAPPLSGW